MGLCRVEANLVHCPLMVEEHMLLFGPGRPVETPQHHCAIGGCSRQDMIYAARINFVYIFISYGFLARYHFTHLGNEHFNKSAGSKNPFFKLDDISSER